MKQLLALLLLCAAVCTKAQNISILVPRSLDTSITSITIKDVQGLLKQACSCEVTLNDSSASVVIKLPVINKEAATRLNHFAKAATFPYRNYPEHNYTWRLQQQGSQTVLQLTTISWQGVSFGLYGLLQEKLGFSFYHPKAMVVPHWTEFPLKKPFTWNAVALFPLSEKVFGFFGTDTCCHLSTVLL